MFFIDVPEPLRPDAVQCALLLLPEEHLEALQSLLIFLAEVCYNPLQYFDINVHATKGNSYYFK